MFSQLSLPLIDDSQEQSVLAHAPIKELALVMNVVRNARVLVNNHSYSVDDFCLRPLPNGNGFQKTTPLNRVAMFALFLQVHAPYFRC
jgi:hypothetical protein